MEIVLCVKFRKNRLRANKYIQCLPMLILSEMAMYMLKCAIAYFNNVLLSYEVFDCGP